MDTASPHLARIGALSRPTGGAGVTDARAYCAGVLRSAGFAISEHSFEYSAFPASWAMSIFGALATLTATALFLARGNPAWTAVAVVGLAIGLGALAYLGRQGVLDFPLMRRRGVNLQAVRPWTEPTVWLVAHVDSKWQPISMIARVTGVVGTSAGIVAMLIVALVPGLANAHVALILWLLTSLASIPLMLSVVGDRNHGTVDNASGVAAVLEAAEALPLAARVGVLITDAEELALAGARAWARTRHPSIALNCDSIDDEGEFLVMYSGARPASLVTRFEATAASIGEPASVRRLIPGILTDSVALADAGWEALTLSRGTIRTLQRIHTSRDTLSAMRGTGISGAARILARMAMELG